MTRGSAAVKRGDASIADCRGHRALPQPERWEPSRSF